MKTLVFLGIAALFVIASGVFVPPRPGHKKHLLGSKECTWGPSYWCQNLTSAADCHATKHCIQTVWLHKHVEPDATSVCQTCLDMVKQARDQLESNETQELIKEVFETECSYLRIKPIVKECDKIADNYIPDLIDTLASEMNPQVVCSVAGLCNSEKVHRLLAEAGEMDNEKKQDAQPTSRVIKSCDDCHTVADIVVDKFNALPRDDFLQNLLQFCGRFGSFSDGCSNIVISYFSQIYTYLKANLNSEDVCLLAGECSAQFHQHANVEITPISKIGYVNVQKTGDDLPCELCEQLVNHLRDLLIANTTEDEFKKVVEGLCEQTGSFAKECLSLADQYYAEVYDYLVHNLNSTVACDAIGICPTGAEAKNSYFVAPLLPVETSEIALQITPGTNRPPVHVNIPKNGVSVKVLPPMDFDETQPLPIELLAPPHSDVLYNQEVCVFCEYFLHYVQQAITDPTTEDEIKEVIDKACSKLPNSVNETCVKFVDTYEPALVAILAQQIDPSQVCPLIKACPSVEVKDVEVFMHQKNTDGDGKCPLCLYAVTELESVVKNKKNKAEIKKALDNLCTKLPKSLSEECVDFVNTYSDELIEMIIADFKPQEVCVALKLCSDDRPPSDQFSSEDVFLGGNVETNVIPDNTINGKPVELEEGPQCVLCEFVMKEIDDQLKDKKTDEDIKKAVENVCNVMPKSIRSECTDFVDQYSDTIIALLAAALEPSDICSYLKLCHSTMAAVKADILDCAICEATVEAMSKILANPKVDHDVEHVLEKTCRGLPKRYRNKCTETIEDYGELMIDLLVHYTNKKFICVKLGQCKGQVYRPVMIEN